MANPFNDLNPINAYDMGGIQNAYKAIMGARNPMQAFQSLAMGNPRLQPIMQALQSGANPQQLFNSICRQRGIDPNDFLRRITGNNGR